MKNRMSVAMVFFGVICSVWLAGCAAPDYMGNAPGTIIKSDDITKSVKVPSYMGSRPGTVVKETTQGDLIEVRGN